MFGWLEMIIRLQALLLRESASRITVMPLIFRAGTAGITTEGRYLTKPGDK